MYHGDKMVKPKSEHSSLDVNSMEELKMEHIPKKTKKRDELVSESDITKIKWELVILKETKEESKMTLFIGLYILCSFLLNYLKTATYIF